MREDGIALIMALGVMLALTIGLTTVILVTAAGARDTQRTNAGQKAYSLAEAGINNAMSILRPFYAVSTNIYPGDKCLLHLQGAPTTYYQGYQPPATDITSCSTPAAFQSTFNSGSCTSPVNSCTIWSGALQAVTGKAWDWQWDLHSTGYVQNPTGPNTKTISRTVDAIVPLIPGESKIGGDSTLDWVYGQNIIFGQSVHVASPVFAVHDVTLGNSAVVCGTAGKMEVGGNLTLGQPANQVGQLTASGPTQCSPSDPKVPEVHVAGLCTWKNQPGHTPCSSADNVFATVSDTSFDSTLASTLNASFPDPVVAAQNARPGPGSGHSCTNTTNTPMSLGGGNAFNFSNPASPVNPDPIDLTPNASYTCQVTIDSVPVGELSWNNASSGPGAKTLTILGTIYINGTATVSQAATYKGKAILFLTGGFFMDANNEKLCAQPVTPTPGADCDLTSGTWDPNVSVLIVDALGTSTRYATVPSCGGSSPVGIELKNQMQFQGALLANNWICADTNAVVEGPMDSKNGTVNAGESGTLTYPPIHFLPSGLTNSNTPGRLLTPRNYTGG